ncbi:PIN domain-containing protein [Cryobacterium sp. TMT1-3]|nr:PIN domain-containing protein [Cryobacterium sp. TMT1-3]
MLHMDRSVFREAGLLTGASLRSLDALHIAAALQAEANEFITYDARQQAAAKAVGLRLRAPGRS